LEKQEKTTPKNKQKSDRKNQQLYARVRLSERPANLKIITLMLKTSFWHVTNSGFCRKLTCRAFSVENNNNRFLDWHTNDHQQPPVRRCGNS